ncbi:hypothetical protein [Terrarubrum flagellatum]|uniref:hypothetical protein n=1 Tax=Terrirubrum flagellatum TaxID=2895980 RepID=UPI0031456C7D
MSNFISQLHDASSKALRYFRFPRDLRLIRQQLGQLSRELSMASDARYADPRHLCRLSGQVYSQNFEDGIIQEIFRRIGTKDRFFVEIGVGDGLENNTRLLLETGWRGVWMEGDPALVRRIQKRFAAEIAAGDLTVVHAMIDRDNVEQLMRDAGVPEEIDFLSVDVDYNTHHVWRAIRSFRYRVACIEYNASYPPSLCYEERYDATRMWDKSNRFGASLKALERIGEDRGMTLVGCDWHGVNSFFVAKELVDAQFVGPFTAEAQYHPPRYQFEGIAGHPRFVPH